MLCTTRTSEKKNMLQRRPEAEARKISAGIKTKPFLFRGRILPRYAMTRLLSSAPY